MLATITLLTTTFAQSNPHDPYLLTEGEIYQFWVKGATSSLFSIETQGQSSALTVYTTDLRPSHTDGHDHRAMAIAYPPSVAALVNFTVCNMSKFALADRQATTFPLL